MVAVDDIGGIVAGIFEHPGKWQDRALDLAGDELSMGELARVFTRAADAKSATCRRRGRSSNGAPART